MGKYFSLVEMCRSAKGLSLGIANVPDAQAKAKIEALIVNVLDPLRRDYGRAITVNSGYRCPALNKAIGGVTTSQHMKGEAADITGGSKAENKKIFELAKKLPFDQLINEKNYTWIHVSFGTRNRKQILKID
ncbi:MAG: D-Ala-D-Ala carboxypeptidase family metallohydrolase [Muribaculaceae bacterium]